MVYTTASGTQIPQGTDAFNPPAQFRTWADHDSLFEYFMVVALDTDRTSITTPELRDGLRCYVQATNILWLYEDATWKNMSFRHTEYTATSASVVSATTSSVGTLVIDTTSGNDTTMATISTNTLTIAENGFYSIDIDCSIPVAPTGVYFAQVLGTVGTVFTNVKVTGVLVSGGLGGSLLSGRYLAAGTVLTFTFYHTSAANRVLTSRISISKHV
jgi:hypothetical protein